MAQFAGSCRFVFNKALALEKEAQAQTGYIGYLEMSRRLTEWRRETAWLAEAPRGALNHALKQLDCAYQSFFSKKSAPPGFRKKGGRDSFRFPDPETFRIEEANGRIKLPKLGWIRYRKSRSILGKPKNITLTRSGAKWFAAVQTELDAPCPEHPSPSCVGVDLGIRRFATLSDGTVLPPCHPFQKHRARLARCQRALRRKVKFGKNWRKTQDRIQAIHRRIANTRNDFLHKASTAISKSHAIAVVEDLHVRRMSRSFAGTREHPGTGVRAKAVLNLAIRDQGWAEFRRQLGYKLAWRGGRLIAVDARHTSTTCPHCGLVAAENRVGPEIFLCAACGFSEHADLVAAINIRAAGHAVLACGGKEHQVPPRKQEPVEARERLQLSRAVEKSGHSAQAGCQLAELLAKQAQEAHPAAF